MDVFVADLWRLGSLVDGWVYLRRKAKIRHFYGLPAIVKQQIKTACSIERMGLYKVIDWARVLVSSGNVVETGAAANFDRGR